MDDEEFFFSAFLGPVGAILDGICWGAVIGGAGYTATVAFSDGGFSNWNWGDFAKSLGIGAISGGTTAGIGQMFGTVGSMGFAHELGRAYVHGFSQGMISGFAGGDFLSGFASGGLGSVASSAFMMYGGELASSSIGNYAFSGVAGGVGAELSGGDFWKGASIGVMNAGLNHLKGKVQKYAFFDRLRNHYEDGTGENFYITRDEFKYLLKKGKIDFEGAVFEDGHYRALIDLYDSGFDLKYSFGTSTVYYKMENGRYIYYDFRDTYNFDSKPWGDRSISNEIITRMYNIYSNGKSFEIYYRRR